MDSVCVCVSVCVSQAVPTTLPAHPDQLPTEAQSLSDLTRTNTALTKLLRVKDAMIWQLLKVSWACVMSILVSGCFACCFAVTVVRQSVMLGWLCEIATHAPRCFSSCKCCSGHGQHPYLSSVCYSACVCVLVSTHRIVIRWRKRAMPWLTSWQPKSRYVCVRVCVSVCV